MIVDRVPEDVPTLAGGSPRVVEMARRMGPLHYAALDATVGSSPVDFGTTALAGWITDTIDEWWQTAGKPDPYTVVEVGAGDGSRARQVLESGPECLGALRYVLVDEGFRDAQARLLPIESPAFLFPGGPDDTGDDDPEEGDGVAASIGIGPIVTSLVEMPVIRGYGAVIAIGSVGRLGSDRVEWREGRWWEIRVSALPDVDGLVEMPVPLVDAALEGARGLMRRAAGPSEPAASPARFAVLGEAAGWLSGSLRVAEAGMLAVVDRWTDATEALGEDEVPPLALDQLVHIRRPIEKTPTALFDGLSVVIWRLG